jgi:predicted ATPase/DNA-binding winged helix-turn-helix (wHTH) protein
VSEFLLFGSYRLSVTRRRLEQSELPVELGDRALDILCVLAARAGEIVTNRELMALVWGPVVVGEGSLRFHINALRKALAQEESRTQYIKNVARRGYVFVAPVHRVALAPPALASDQMAELGKLPKRPSGIVGRGLDIKDILATLGETRFVTIVGPGGVGKTTVALEVAHTFRERFDRVSFVDLETIKDPAWVASAVAAGLGLIVSSANPVSSLIAYLRDKRVLLILDSCERVLEAVAMLAEQIFDGSAGSAILATSQEAVRADGERIYTLAPLCIPADAAELTPEFALRYPSVELFAARASAALKQFQLTAANVGDIVSICRSVHGIPLAIELAAGRVGTLALPTIVKLLNSQFSLTWPGRRTASQRHRTLGNAIAWTVELLDDWERVVLRRLSVFSAPFTLEAAQCVAGEALPADSVVLALSNLVGKSLVSSSTLAQSTHFWLLGATRAFASRMLEESGEASSVERSHALFFCELLEDIYAVPAAVAGDEPWSEHAAYLSNIRSALQWAHGQKDEMGLMSRLAAAAGPFLLDLSLLNDCIRWTEIGLAALDNRQRERSAELEPHASLGLSLFFGRGSFEQARISLNRALQLAEAHQDRHNQIRLIGALDILGHRTGGLLGGLRLVERAQTVARTGVDPAPIPRAREGAQICPAGA